MARKRKRSRISNKEFVLYEARVEGWDYSYHFRSVDPKSRLEQGPYSELATLTFACSLVHPDSVANQKCVVILSPRSGLLEYDPEHEFMPVGTITMNADELTIYVFVPTERMNAFVSVAASDCLQRVSFSATRLRYRRALVYSISLDTSPSDEE